MPLKVHSEAAPLNVQVLSVQFVPPPVSVYKSSRTLFCVYVGIAEGITLGIEEALGIEVGKKDGCIDGVSLGCIVGKVEGIVVGLLDKDG